MSTLSARTNECSFAAPEIICLGILVADVWGRPIDEWPQRGRLSLVDEIGIGIGGCAANTGIGLRKLGASVSIIGAVGQDGFGSFVRETLGAEGIDTGRIVSVPGASTSATMIIVDSAGERTFIHNPGANGRLRPDHLDMEFISAARILHFAGALVMPGFDGDPAASVLRAARQAGVTTSVDTVWDSTGQWMTLMEPVLRETDIFTPGLAEAEQLTGLSEPDDIAEALMDLGVRVVALKMGAAGCYVATRDARLRLKAFPVEVVDGTGAGDAFAAGFLYGMLREWDLERAARLGNAVGGLCCTAAGATAGLRSLDETLAFMQQAAR